MEEKLLSKVDRQALIELTRNIVTIPSPTGYEEELSLYLANELAQLGMAVKFQEVEPGRANVIGTLKGEGQGPSLMFLAHFDTVTPGREDPDRLEPHEFAIQDDWMFGIGIANMKSAFSAYIMATRILIEAGVQLKGDIIIAGVVGEIEKAQIGPYQGRNYRGGALGAGHLVNQGVVADLSIIGEPTGLRLQNGNLGYIFARLTVKGLAQHTHCKHLGKNPIPEAIRLIEAITNWEPKYQQKHSHSFMKPLIGLGALEAGFPYKPSVCPPPSCSLYLDIRTLPGTKPVEILRELEDVVNQCKPRCEVEVELYKVSPGYEIPKDHFLVHVMDHAHREVFGRPPIYPEPSRYSVASDGSILSTYGIPAITYGPGGISREESYYDMLNQESVSIENLENCIRVYALAAQSICTKTMDEVSSASW